MKSIFLTKILFKEKLLGVILVDSLKGILTVSVLKVIRYRLTKTCKQNLTHKTTNFFSKKENSKLIIKQTVYDRILLTIEYLKVH